jgi:hypothetical protein
LPFFLKDYDFGLKKCIIGLKKGPSLVYFDVILTSCLGPTPFSTRLSLP